MSSNSDLSTTGTTNPPIYLIKLCFDISRVGSNLVLTFDSCNNDGNFITPEGIMVNSVLQFGKNGDPDGA